MTNNSRRSLGWVMTVPCTSKKALRTDSQKGIAEILNTKLATIVEEPENFYEGNHNHNHNQNRAENNNVNAKISSNISSMKLWFKGKKKANDLARSTKLQFKRSKVQIVSHHFCVNSSYVNFVAAFLAKGSFIGLPRY